MTTAGGQVTDGVWGQCVESFFGKGVLHQVEDVGQQASTIHMLSSQKDRTGDGPCL